MAYQQLCTQTKNIYDSIHGYIPITNFALHIIDHPYFQRLRKLKQLGTCNYVFPNAVHTRFEHSIGTYYLASELVKTIQNDDTNYDSYLSQILELQNYYNKNRITINLFDNYICELCKIAALCHDLGHGPFSHVFDDIFLHNSNKKNNLNDLNIFHEHRSGLILELIIKNDEYLHNIIGPDEIQFMKNLINPQKQHKGFIYQIVSNNLNSLDVDKYDYIVRDSKMLLNQINIDCSRLIKHVKIIDNNIVYPEQALYDIYSLFQTRHRLHRQIYCHKCVISVQFMITEILMLLDPILDISNSINDMDKFCKLNDEYCIESIKILNLSIVDIPEKYKINLQKAQTLLNLIEQHKFYIFIDSCITTTFLDVSQLFKDPNILIFSNKLGFVSGNKTNPLDDIYIYKTKHMLNNITAIKQDKTLYTALMPNIYQEYITMIFSKTKLDFENINKIKLDFKDYINLI